MGRYGTNELISGEKFFIAILSNLHNMYFVVRLPDYVYSVLEHIDTNVTGMHTIS